MANPRSDRRLIPRFAEFAVERGIRSSANPDERAAAYQQQATGRIVRISQTALVALADILIALRAVALHQVGEPLYFEVRCYLARGFPRDEIPLINRWANHCEVWIPLHQINKRAEPARLAVLDDDVTVDMAYELATASNQSPENLPEFRRMIARRANHLRKQPAPCETGDDAGNEGIIGCHVEQHETVRIPRVTIQAVER